MNTPEIWTDILDFPGYQISSLGQVRSLDRVVIRSDGRPSHLKGRMLRPGKNQDGYLLVVLSSARRRWTRLVHDLVAAAFLGERPPDHEVHHRNSKRTDNRLCNLAYRPGSQHIRDHFTGEDNPAAKLTNDRVAEIKSLLQQGVQGKMIARMFGVHPAIITRIKHNRAWSHVKAPAADQLFLEFSLDTVSELAF